MAKIKHHNFLNTVHEVFTDAKNAGVLHLYAGGASFSGRTIEVEGKELYHFGTTGYLGLEQDPRLKRAAKEAIDRYGTQFPLSKSYISNPLYEELENSISEMYGYPIVITKNSTLGHLGVIPSAVDDEDVIILDHQVHWSVQNAAKMLKTRSVPIEMIRHNQLEMLEDKIKKYQHSKGRIWYMADGIYSMYGDYAPVKELMGLAKKYPQLHFYFDDVHGMSWVGRNGTGYVLDQLGELHENVLLFGTLSKTFGASGAVLACSNASMYDKIKTFGGPLTFSAQLEPASVAAAMASAKIHLSPEIYGLQKELRERIDYFNDCLSITELPLIDRNESPVFYIGTGMPKTGYNFVNRLMGEGFFVNLGIFPAVPVKNTGVRITISRHNQKKEIKALVEAMEYHFPKALEDTQTDAQRVFHAFKMEPKTLSGPKVSSELTVEVFDTIDQVEKEEWNQSLGGQGVYDWDALKFLEEVFQGNPGKEHNWLFRYVVIKDTDGIPVLMTFVTLSLWKDDMLAQAQISAAIEEERKTDPYHLSSMVLSLGCLFTEGDHLYWNASHRLGMEARDKLLETLEKLELQLGAKIIVLRDFGEHTSWNEPLYGQGFLRVQMPNACYVVLNEVDSMEDYLQRLSSRNRRHFRKDVQPYLDKAKTVVLPSLSTNQIEQVKSLFGEVQSRNLGLNTFSFPDSLFVKMNENHLWEFIVLCSLDKPEKIVGVMFCYTNLNQVYVPAFVGMDYEDLEEFAIYRQLLYRTIERAIGLGIPKIDFGLTAAFEKRKLGATVEKKYAYLQTNDNFILELLGIMEGQHQWDIVMKYQKLLSEFEGQLDALESGNGDILFKAEKGIVLVEKSIRKLQKQITGKTFESQADEIYFFKHVKPQIFSKLIYYVKLFNIESKRPRGINAAQIKYLQHQIDKFQTFFNDNLEFYNYYRRGAMSLDEQYFVRGNRDLRLPLESFHFLIDDQFSTCQDGTVATIMAYDMLIVYLRKEVDDLQNNLEPQKTMTMEKPSKLFWTGNKTDLIELLYALQSSKCINSGTTDIKEMASHFEHFYNVDLGNYYHTFIDIRSRKGSRTRFLDKLIEMLQQRMESLDE